MANTNVQESVFTAADSAIVRRVLESAESWPDFYGAAFPGLTLEKGGVLRNEELGTVTVAEYAANGAVLVLQLQTQWTEESVVVRPAADGKNEVLCGLGLRNGAMFTREGAAAQKTAMRQRAERLCRLAEAILHEGWPLCPLCQTPNDPTARFCGKCGGPLGASAPEPSSDTHTCADCGTVFPSECRFCPMCGKPQTPSAPVDAPAVVAAPVAEAPAEAPVAEEPAAEEPAAEAPAEEKPAIVCGKCGAAMLETDKFCPVCGARKAAPAEAAVIPVPAEVSAEAAPVEEPAAEAPVEEKPAIVCGKCGAAMLETDKFCPVCGARKAAPAEAAVIPVPAEAPAEAAPVEEPAAEEPAAEAPVEEKPAIVCGKCGAAMLETDKFCPVCGARKAAPAEAAVIPVPAEAPAEAPVAEEPVAEEPAAEATVEEKPAIVCGKCGAVLSTNDKFCLKCGTPVGAPVEATTAPVCAGCGTALESGDKFCPTCGKPQQ